MSAGNESRPPMRDIIRHEDRRCLTTEEWKAIRQSAVTVVRTCLETLSTRHLPSSAANVPRKKNFYRRYFLKEWSQALRELELLAPLLTLCAGVWKADKTIGTVLQDSKSGPQEPSRPPSRASSVTSSLSRAASRASTPGLAPPSSTIGSSRGAPSSTLASSRAAPSSCQSRPSPHRVILNKSSVRPRPVSGAAEPASANKGAASKGKRRHEPSPLLTEKRAKGDEDQASNSGMLPNYSRMQLTTYIT